MALAAHELAPDHWQPNLTISPAHSGRTQGLSPRMLWLSSRCQRNGLAVVLFAATPILIG